MRQMRNRSTRWLLILVVLLTMGLSLPALPARAAGGNLERLLAQVPAVPTSRTVLWYGSQSALQQALGINVSSNDELAKLNPQQSAVYLKSFGAQFYYSPFLGIENAAKWRSTFGFDVFQVDRELTVGTQSLGWFDIMEGRFDVGAINTALGALGYQPTPSGAATLYTSGDSNPAAELSQSRYDRLLVNDKQIVAAPGDALLGGMLDATNGKAPALSSDPAYLAAARALEVGDVPLLSAVLLDGLYVQQTLLVNVPGALPRYSVAGIGYRLPTKTAQSWTIALVYPNKASADAAAQALPNILRGYKSAQQGGRLLFASGQISASIVTPSADGKTFTLSVTVQFPTTADVGLVTLFQNRDIGFLAVR